jgi:hypothetical protein
MMEQAAQLSGFYQAIASDNRIGATHISLYMALFQLWNLNHCKNPVPVRRDEVMPVAKISSKATYHKCIKELEQYGYIHYYPSRNHIRKSSVFIDDLQQMKKNG